MATMVPSPFNDTEYPLSSLAASPSMSPPCLYQPGELICSKTSLKSLKVPTADESPHERAPLPSVFNIWSAVPSVLGNVKSVLVVKLKVPTADESPHERAPLPSVFKIWSAVPSVVGRVKLVPLFKVLA